MADNEVTTSGPRSLTIEQVNGAVTPLSMLNQAVARGDSIDVLERLMGLHERWEANEARKAFNEAYSSFKAEVVTIVRNREITDGPLKGRKYAELFSFVDAVTPALSKHGLSASWSITKDDKDWIEVTCTVEHVFGGNKKVSIGGPPDTGGAKNAIQARLSAITYLERGTLKAACGLAEQGDDKDGAALAVVITQPQADQLQKLIDDAAFEVDGADADYAAWLTSFLAYMRLEKLGDLAANNYDKAVQAIAASKKARAKK